jgi:hypothetical protein
VADPHHLDPKKENEMHKIFSFLGAALGLAAILVGMHACDDDNGGGVSASELCNACCNQYQECASEEFYEYYDDVSQCVDECLSYTEVECHGRCDDEEMEYGYCLCTLDCDQVEDSEQQCSVEEQSVEDCWSNAPTDWTCSPDFYGTCDGCDCGCGKLDLDCEGPGVEHCEFCDLA